MISKVAVLAHGIHEEKGIGKSHVKVALECLAILLARLAERMKK